MRSLAPEYIGLVVVVLLYTILPYDSFQYSYTVVTVCTSIYLGTNIYVEYSLHRKFNALKPICILSIMFYTLCYLLPIFGFLSEDVLSLWDLFLSARIRDISILHEWIYYHSVLIHLFCVTTWMFYKISCNYNLNASVAKLMVLTKVSKVFDPKLQIALILIASSIFVKLVSINLNTYGYTANPSSLQTYGGIVPLFSYADSAGLLGLLLFAGYEENKNGSLGLKTFLLTITFMIFGTLSLFKSQVVFPVIVVALGSYLASDTFRLRWIAAIIASLFLGYVVVVPLRNASGGYATETRNSTTKLVSKAFSSASKSSKSQSESTTLEVLNRVNLTMLSAFTLKQRYDKDFTLEKLTVDGPAYLIPLYAFIPRLLWTNKPLLGLDGNLFAQYVFKWKVKSSLTPGPFGYIFISGLSIGFCFGFAAYLGILSTAMEGIVAHGGGGLVIFIGLLGYLVTINEPHLHIVGILKDLPVLYIGQLVLFGRRSIIIPGNQLSIT